METEGVIEGMEEKKTEGEMKNSVNMVTKKQAEEPSSKASIKENGMSDHSERKHDLTTADGNDSSKNHSNGEDHLSESNKLNKDEDMNVNENGEIAANDTDGDKETEDSDSVIQNNFGTSENNVLDSESDSDTKLDKAGTINEEDSKLESVENSEESQDSVTDDKKERIEVMEKSEPSGLEGLASEDSSKDSTDSSLSDAASGVKEDKNIDSVESNEAADVDHIMNSFEKDLKEDVEMDAEKEKKKEPSENSSEDGYDKIKDEKMEVEDENKLKTEVNDDNKSDDKKENESSEKISDSVKDANVADATVKPPTLQQPSGSYMLPVSSVPYVLSQQPMTVHQQQTGYITKVGNQHIFVPVPGAGPLAGAMPTTTSLTPSQPPAKPTATEKPADLAPKSSFEMIELMKWEIQNRIPDNYNWSVAFHPKKEELSTVSAFLLELGHDVVKEAVYKDIILIQTKKKDQGILKETEVESLEKMKTVYENTKKKVEHLDMKKMVCRHKPCRFQTTSSVVMNHHKDHPHVDPPWDWHGGYLCCAHCDFRTKQTAAFSFHMETIHKEVAKMPDKPGLFPCEMCPMDLSTKNKLLKHRVKCMKTFKLNVNLQPYYHDVNFCMKTCYYKPKKPKYIPPPKKPDPRQVAARQLPNRSAGMNQVGIRQNLMQPQFAPRPPPLQRHPVSITPIVRAPPAAFKQAQPPISKSPVVRQMIQQQKQGGTPPAKEMSGFEVCELCGGYVKDRQALRIHFYYAHKVEMPQTIFNRPTPPLSCDVCQSKFWTTQGLQKHKSTLRHYSTATSNVSKPAHTSTHKCFMCNRNVTNLFIHVEQSHGMTMKDLVAMKKCIMCGITAADRKQLEVHMSTLHGVLIKANDYVGTEKPAQPAKNAVPPQPKATTPNAPAAAPNKGKSMVRNNLCVFCQIQFADNIQLTMHCIKIHATCSACGMVVASSKNLANHNCKKMMRDCDICGLKKLAPDAYAVHIKKHVKPCSVKVDNMSDQAVESTKEDIKKNYKPAVISLDSDSGGESDVEVVDDNAKTEKRETKKKSGNENNIRENANESEKANVKKSIKDDKNLNQETSEEIEEEDRKVENEARKEAAGSDSDESGAASKDSVMSNNKDESSQDSKNESESKLGIEDELSRGGKSGSDSKISNVDDSSQGSLNEPESNSARNTVENQGNRKRKINQDSDSDESKRLKTESDNMTEDNVSDSESKGAEDSNIHGADGDDIVDDDDDSAGGTKRPCEEVQEDAGGDSGTESDQASKRRKLSDNME